MSLSFAFDKHSAALLAACGYVWEHHPPTWEDVGGPENGPMITGGPAYDTWTRALANGDSHEIIVVDGLVVDEVTYDAGGSFEVGYYGMDEETCEPDMRDSIAQWGEAMKTPLSDLHFHAVLMDETMPSGNLQCVPDPGKPFIPHLVWVVVGDSAFGSLREAEQARKDLPPSPMGHRVQSISFATLRERRILCRPS